MPIRCLGVLKNLGEHANHNQARNIKWKVQKGASVPIPLPKGKENRRKVKEQVNFICSVSSINFLDQQKIK